MRYSIGLPELRPLLQENGVFGAPSYRDLYKMVLDGRLPARKIRGRWYIERDDIDGIIHHFMKPARAQSPTPVEGATE